ncbi:multidrug efflux system outer membrane protein [Pseudomonas helmanticensis]|uniref:Multidrug efflux system outer membrane protein n=1 Tax=Pseudomonas helmanticensis TaxID=1471381 RepID=A0A4R7VJB1_9PSED|nr:efflux transporter outer membrane subunit [Pseudomonas helmanticensis]TDV49524.1 multidrug efflux system outer membrane protein [Pseudomonas helmanticensis]
MKHKPLLLVLAMTLSGCNLIPEYQRPDAPIPQAFPQDAGYEAPLTGHVALIGWRTFFKDPAMHRLVDLALANNRDLRKAALNVAAYRAQYRIQGSALLPQIEMDGTGGRSRTPADMSNTGQQVTTGDNSLQVGLTSYEMDVWGRIRSLDRNALETYLASEETQRSVQIGLVAEVAVAYLTWETDRQLLSVTRSTLENYRHNLELIQASSEAGTASDLDVRQARTLVDSARGQVQAYTRQVAQDINALRLLLGTSIPDNLPETDMEGQLMAEIPAGMPANLLQQRPDIRAAEHQLLAANANIGAARAAFFPSITLTAGAGTASSQLSGLFNGGSETWSFIPQIHLPIFTGGRLKASLDYAKIQKDIGVANYEQTIQVSFREVSDGLAAMGTWAEQIKSQQDLVRATDEYTQMALQRYEEGVDNYMTLLDAQRQLLSARQQLLNGHLAKLGAQIQLYKALGGGWTETET